MSQIFNKSTHPVAIKRIPVRVWALRDEIEAALNRRLKECEAAGSSLFIDDIKNYYGMTVDRPLSAQPQLQLVSNSSESGESSAENSVDAMMEALAETPQDAPEPQSDEVVKKADELIAAQTPAEKAQGPAPHLQRPYTRECPDSAKVSYGFAFLSDVNMDWMLTFSKEKFTQGQSIVIEFLIPRPFMLSGEIMLCHNYAMRSRIISETKPDYRLQIRFTYQLSGERGYLRDFLTSIEPNIPKRTSTKTVPDETGPDA